MRTLRAQRVVTNADDELEISAAAIGGYARLRRAVGSAIVAHVRADGSLICEDRRVAARPTMWQISTRGTISPDAPYNFLVGGFVAAKLPRSA